jgi:hypothetical protein
MKKNLLWIQNSRLKQLHKTFKTISGSRISDENKGMFTGYLFSEHLFFIVGLKNNWIEKLPDSTVR